MGGRGWGGGFADHGCKRWCRSFRWNLTTAKNTTQEAAQSSKYHGYGEGESVDVVLGYIGIVC